MGAATPTITPAAPSGGWDPAACGALAARVSAGAAGDVLRRKRASVLTARATTDDGTPVVVRLWDQRGARAMLARASGAGPRLNEWRALGLLHPQGMSPRPYWHGRLRAGAHTDALVMEDLGETVRGSDRLRELVRSGDTGGLGDFDGRLILATRALLEAGIVDIDHTLTNFIVPGDGVPRRVDLEFARRVGHARLAPWWTARMLGRLLGSYVFGVQPQVAEAERFAALLWEGVRVGRGLRKQVGVIVEDMLDRQQQETGVRTRVRLP